MKKTVRIGACEYEIIDKTLINEGVVSQIVYKNSIGHQRDFWEEEYLLKVKNANSGEKEVVQIIRTYQHNGKKFEEVIKEVKKER